MNPSLSYFEKMTNKLNYFEKTKPKKFVSSVEVRLKKGRNEFSNFKLLCFEEYLVAFKALDQPISERTNADGSDYHFIQTFQIEKL